MSTFDIVAVCVFVFLIIYLFALTYKLDKQREEIESLSETLLTLMNSDVEIVEAMGELVRVVDKISTILASDVKEDSKNEQ